MRFLIDVCASSRRMRATLASLGHDVVSALEDDRQASDETLLARATAEERVLITEDKDFGELVFVHRLPHPCIIRFVEMTVGEKVSAMEDLLDRHGAAIRQGTIIVVTKSRVRIRYNEAQPGGNA